MPRQAFLPIRAIDHATRLHTVVEGDDRAYRLRVFTILLEATPIISPLCSPSVVWHRKHITIQILAAASGSMLQAAMSERVERMPNGFITFDYLPIGLLEGVWLSGAYS